ncbi:MAG TPA: HEAT repeat domain-containing protein [Nitrospiraceae bacterium]|nr:HEAT repeat domain-containing protein [Nitrospiraceae bacterium]
MSKESLETLISELTHEEDWRRMRATAACLAGGPKAVDGLIHALEIGDTALRMEAAGMLARIKDPRGGVPLVRLLNDGDPSVRKAGAIALEQMAGVLDTASATALVQDLHEFQEDDQKQAVIALLGVIPNSIEPLTAMLKHADENARVTAATILEHLLDPRAADALVESMADPDVQAIAVRTLKKLGAIRERIDRAFDALREVEESNLREDARMSTVIDLLGIGRPSVEILIDYLRDDDWVVREAAADLLGKIGDIRAVDPLIERLRIDKDTGVKEIAAKSLGLIGDARPVDLLVELIPIRPLRIFAVEALAKVKDTEKLRPYAELFERLKTDRDGIVSYNAGMIVDKLNAMAAQSAEQAHQEEVPHE